MGAVQRGRNGSVKAEINVTPLVDVVFVLLIVFMVLTPLMSNGKEVPLPEVPSATGEQPAKLGSPFIVALTVDKRLWLDNDEVDARELVQQTRKRLKARPDLEILLKADKDLAVADVRPLLRQLQDAGAQRVGFVVAEQPERAKP